MLRRIGFGVRAAGLLVAMACPAFPIVLQYDQILTTGSPGYPSVVRVGGGCSGALLADGVHVLTAAHCVSTYSSPDNINTIFNLVSNLSVGVFTPGSSVSIPVSGIHLNPLAALMFPSDSTTQLLIYDLAVLDLSTPAPADAGGYLIDASGNAIVNHGTVTLAGWGLGGYPGGTVGGAGTRRAATNVVAGVFAAATDVNATPDTVSLPDLPIALIWDTTSSIHDPNNLTGLGDHGDSGSPLTYNGNLIGVLSFGTLPDAGGQVVIGQRYYNGYTNLAVQGNAEFLASILNSPEPGTFAMIGLGALVLVAARRSRPSVKR
jgi:hypothetical protein